MSEAEGPEPQVGGGVRDAAQAVLDGVDGLVDHGVPKVKLSWEETREKRSGREGTHRWCCGHLVLRAWA